MGIKVFKVGTVLAANASTGCGSAEAVCWDTTFFLVGFPVDAFPETSKVRVYLVKAMVVFAYLHVALHPVLWVSL